MDGTHCAFFTTSWIASTTSSNEAWSKTIEDVQSVYAVLAQELCTLWLSDLALNNRSPNGKPTGHTVDWGDDRSGELKMEIQIRILGCPTAEKSLSGCTVNFPFIDDYT